MAKEKICGIYCIENLVNGKKYIGQSVDVTHRFYDHKSRLNNCKHRNDYLQKSWDKYKKENFKCYLIESCDANNLDDMEKYWIEFYKTNIRKYGYNLDSGGNLNKKVSKSTKEKISKNHADVSGDNNPFYGKHHSEGIMNSILNSDGYKNRKVKGEDAHLCKITYETAKYIKDYFSDGHKLYHGEVSDIAKQFDISIGIVSHIKNGYAWNYI